MIFIFNDFSLSFSLSPFFFLFVSIYNKLAIYKQPYISSIVVEVSHLSSFNYTVAV